MGCGIDQWSESLWLSQSTAPQIIAQTNLLLLLLAALFAAVVGGFITGWLRETSQIIDSNAVYFRDILHGFLMWIITVIIAALWLSLASNTTNISYAEINTAAKAGMETRGKDDGERDSATTDYFVAALSRMDREIAATMPVVTSAISVTERSTNFNALWIFLGLLFGAVIASFAAICGGWQHDATI
jgi:hypothetical protein